MSGNLTVYKYPLPLTDEPGKTIAIKLPAGAKIRKVDLQRVDPLLGPQFAIWALVDPAEQFEDVRHVVTAGTGHMIPADLLASKHWEYTDTILTMGGQFVLHVWISASEGKNDLQVSVEG